jgi:hypothetical protein
MAYETAYSSSVIDEALRRSDEELEYYHSCNLYHSTNEVNAPSVRMVYSRYNKRLESWRDELLYCLRCDNHTITDSDMYS